MSSFTTEEKRPDEGRDSIRHTKGAWIRQHSSGDYELYYDGGFIVSFSNWNENIAAAMCEHAYDEGFRAGERANQNKLRKALGLKP